jgi:hypothetical protein
LDVFSHPDVAALSDGRFFIVARDDTTSALVACIFDPITRAVTPVNFSPPGANPHVAGAPGGGFVVSFDRGGDVDEVRFGPNGSVLFDDDRANSVVSALKIRAPSPPLGLGRFSSPGRMKVQAIRTRPTRTRA